MAFLFDELLKQIEADLQKVAADTGQDVTLLKGIASAVLLGTAAGQGSSGTTKGPGPMVVPLPVRYQDVLESLLAAGSAAGAVGSGYGVSPQFLPDTVQVGAGATSTVTVTVPPGSESALPYQHDLYVNPVSTGLLITLKLDGVTLFSGMEAAVSPIVIPGAFVRPVKNQIEYTLDNTSGTVGVTFTDIITAVQVEATLWSNRIAPGLAGQASAVVSLLAALATAASGGGAS